MNHDLSLFSCQQCRKHHFRLHASLVCYQVDCSDAKIFSKSFPILFFNLLKRTRFFVSVWHRQKRYSIVRSAFVKVLLHCSFENLYAQTDIGNENPALVSVSGILEESDKCAHVLRACIYGCARIAPGGPTSVEQGNQGLEEAEYVFVKHIRETYSWNMESCLFGIPEDIRCYVSSVMWIENSTSVQGRPRVSKTIRGMFENEYAFRLFPPTFGSDNEKIKSRSLINANRTILITSGIVLGGKFVYRVSRIPNP